MGYLVGTLFGSITAMLTAGYLSAWLLRKVTRVTKISSYAIGVSAMTLVGAWSITYEGSPSFVENWLNYVIGAAIALPIMIGVERRAMTHDTADTFE